MKPFVWVAHSQKDPLAMPAAMLGVFGYAMHVAQPGSKRDRAKPLAA